jgi:DNA-binding beta-propeller fold protein YncE/4-amino-4-deoxy-L-arabinose transferase-like glycosyltransferase
MAYSLLDKPANKLLNLDLEKALYVVLIVLALATRLWGLGNRVQSHDESIHTKYSYNLYSGQGFSHHPLMHGPFLFHATAFSFFLFGDNDFSARVPVALMGVIIVAFPYLFRRWLGRKGALAASFFLLISPSIAYYSRYIRHDIPVMLWALITVFAILSYIRSERKSWLYLMAASVSLMFATKEVSFIYSAIFGLFLVGLSGVQALSREWPTERLKAWFLFALSITILGMLILGLGKTLPSLTQAPSEDTALNPSPMDTTKASLPTGEAKTPWETLRDITGTAGIMLTGLGFLATVGCLIAGQLRSCDLKAFSSLSSAVLTTSVMCLLVLATDELLGILFTQKWPSAPDWLAFGGRALVWTAMLVGVIVPCVRQLSRNDPASHQRITVLLITVLMAAGMFIRLGLPVLLSYTTCQQTPQEDIWACSRQALQQFSWPGKERLVLSWLPFTDGVGLPVKPSHLAITVLPFASGPLAALAWLAIRAFHKNRAFDLVVLLSTLCLPFLSPLLMKLVELDPMDYNPPTPYYTGAILIEVFLFSVVVGSMWDLRRRAEGEEGYRWLPAAAIHYAIFIAFFTTFLTNAYGIASGLVGSLGYWLEQQEVERGGQPWYYYIFTVSIYEFLPLLLALIAPLYLAIRGWLTPRWKPGSKRLGEFPGAKEYFVPLVLWWVALTWIGYSIAGEKMPWLTVHVALPMILLGAWLVGRLLDAIDWRHLFQGRAWLLGLLAPPLTIAIAVLTDAISTHPFQGYSLAQLNASGRFVNALIGTIACSTGIAYVVWRSGWRLAARVLLLVALLLPVFLTIRTAWRFCYITYDYATEFLVYAHAAPGVREAMNKIEEISYRYGGGPYAIKVPYGSDGSTLFHWQLRHYPPGYAFGDEPTREQLNAPVIIAASGDWSKVDRYVGNDYFFETYTYIWWPMQDYWNLNWERIHYAISNPDMRAALWDVWYNRDYTRYDEITGETHTLDKWPLRGDFRLYIRHDVAQKVWDLPLTAPPESASGSIPSDPYAAGWQDLTARMVFGTPGSQPGQFQSPRGIKVGADGFVYVADSKNNRVQKLTPNGEAEAAWEQGFYEPWDVAVAPDGTIYVADTWNHMIQRLDANGNRLNAWGTFGQYTQGGNVGQNAFYGPRGIAIGAGGQVYVADTGNKRIQVFEPDGQFAFMWGGGGTQTGYLDEPVGVAIGPNGEVYVADTWNRRIQVFSQTGIFLRQWPIDGWDAGLSEDRAYLAAEEKPYLAVDKNGYVYVTDPGYFRVLVFDSEGNYVLSFGKYGYDESSFTLPTGIAVAEDGSIYVADAQSDRVLVFDPLEFGTAEQELTVPTLKFPVPGSEIPGGKLTLIGAGWPGSRVRVLIDDRLVGTVDTDEDGVWMLTTELTTPGVHEVTLQALIWSSEAGLEVTVTSEPVQLTIRTETFAPPVLDLEEGGQLSPGEVTLNGTGEPDSEVRVLVGGDPIGIAQVDDGGNWSLVAELSEPGEYEIVVEALSDAGEVVATSEPGILVIVDITPTSPTTVVSPTAMAECRTLPGSCAGNTYTVQPGDTLQCISQCTGVTLEALLAANPEIDDPDLILPGQAIVIPR